MTMAGYGCYDTTFYKPKGTEAFAEYFEALYPEGVIEYEESEDTGARAELRADEEGYWRARYMSPFGDRISEARGGGNSAYAAYKEQPTACETRDSGGHTGRIAARSPRER